MPFQFGRLSLFLLLFLAFSSSVRGQDMVEPIYEPERSEPKSLEIKNVKFFAQQGSRKKGNYVEVQAFQETRQLHLNPSNKFDVSCEVVGGSDVLTGDYLLWTAIDFLVASVTRANEQMDDQKLSSSIGWGQVTEMQDLNATAIYLLKPGETRRVVMKGLDLSTVLAAFPVGNSGELWPWLVRVTLHIQDRSGKQIAVAQRTLRLSPCATRESSRYNVSPKSW